MFHKSFEKKNRNINHKQVNSVTGDLPSTGSKAEAPCPHLRLQKHEI